MSRIYKVSTPKGNRLIDADTKGQAIKHCVEGDYTAEVVSASDLYAAIQAGAVVEKVESAKKDDAAGETNGQPASTPSPASTPAPEAPVPQATAPAHAAAAPVASPGANPVLAEQQRINPQAATAAGAPPVFPNAGGNTLPPAAPAQGGPVDWEARERG